jgi:hypothetical protein
MRILLIMILAVAIVGLLVTSSSATITLTFAVEDSRANFYTDMPPVYSWKVNGYLDTRDEVISRLEWAYPGPYFYFEGSLVGSSGFRWDPSYIVYPNPYLHMAADSIDPVGFKGSSCLINQWVDISSVYWTDSLQFGATCLKAYHTDGSLADDVRIMPASLVPVPEPVGFLVLASGLVGMIYARYKR